MRRPNNRHRLPPPGWLDCPAYGNDIDSLIPSKVPLAESFNQDIPPGKRYSSKQLLRVFTGKIGLVIDLTNSSRYYNLSDWNKEGIEHLKIACKGHGSVPDNEVVNKFVFEVSQFRQRQPQKYILVHCTHGHNRTGFMIVHYLMRTRATQAVSEAIKMFAEARPPGIYKPDYIDALYSFYYERKPESMLAVYPPTPQWKLRSSDLDDLNADGDGDDDGDSIAPPDVTNDEKQTTKLTNDDILGDSIPCDQQELYRKFVYQALKLRAGGVRGPQFPGSHPVSLNRENLQLLRQRYYYATWKADGTRYMMLITTDGCYLIDRHFTFRRVQMRFPINKETKGRGTAEKSSFHHFTLLDGEMVIDTLPADTHKQVRRYLVYDMMAVNQISLVARPFYERWKMIQKEIVEPRKKLFATTSQAYRHESEPFRVRRKDFWPLPTVERLLKKEFIEGLSHGADGLIFQGRDDPYIPRTHEGLLKWKYPEMNSVDFLFEMVEGRQLLYLHERGRKKLMDKRIVVFPDDGAEASAAYSGKIIECWWNSEEEVWVCMRVRVDKGTPNELNTYKKVMTSIKDNITQDILLKEINGIIRLPMYKC